ncbi:MAG: amino acid adenylation domain-containing protein, partial [Legionellaceae bacterium]|nr:amino acid adenylation domain-containing protein [Legionellaceae bacterium]
VAFELPNELKSLSAEYNVTHYTTLLTGLAITLSRYTGQTDLTIGTPVANRQHPQLEHLIGFFVNTLVLRIQLDSNHTLSQCVSQIQSDLIEAQLHQDMPFEKLVAELDIERDRSRHPIFQVMYVVEYSDVDDNPEEDHISLNYDVAKFDLSISLRMTPNAIKGHINYATSLFKPETIERFISHYQQILNAMLTCKEQAIGTYPILTQAEYQQIVIDWNKTEQDYPKDKTIHQIFEEQVKKTPNNIAVVFEDQQLTYKQLNEEANQLARYIHKQNPGEFVAICMDRSLEMIVAILGILKAGCAYVPIDPNYPQERIDYILADTKASIVLDNRLKDKPYGQESKKNLTLMTNSNDLAYVIYTSGTTGKPKGVMIEHQSVSQLVDNQREHLHLTAQSNVLQYAKMIFDVSVSELFGALLTGSMLVIIDEEKRLEATRLVNFLIEQRITVAQLTSAILRIIEYRALPLLQTLVVGGEVCDEALMVQWSRGRRLINAYGPTEATVCALMHDYQLGDSSETIGKPLSGVLVYVLDPQLRPVAVGITGELFIGGAGLARGYLNQPELTKARFIPNPFGAGRLYKTGDLVRWLPDGNLEYIGRNDFQVKIRGYRIELGEIEHVLSAHPNIRQSVVLAHDAKLIAYYVGQTNEPLDDYLRSKLPDYMIPSAFIAIESFPLTINGKLDRAALPLPDFSQNQESYTAPRNSLEALIVHVWQSVLKLNRIGIQDDFFRLGGDSIQSIQVSSRLQHEGIDIRVRDIFTKRTIQALAGSISQSKPVYGEQGILTGGFDLLPIQQWFFAKHLKHPGHWNQSFITRTPELSITRLTAILRPLMERHDVLRLRFKNGQQFYTDNVSVPSISTAKDFDSCTAWQSHFNLSEGPLWQMGYVEGGYLFFAAHHLIIDTVSWRILMDDIQRLYEGDSLGVKCSSYRQWVAAVQNYPNQYPDERDYWLRQVTSNPDIPLTSNASFADCELDKALTQQLLTHASKAYHTEINDLLLTALAYALYDWTGQMTHGITLEGHGRELIDETIDVSRTVGWFTTQYPVKLSIKDSLSESIRGLKEDLRKIPNKGIGFAVFFGHAELPDIKFNYLGQFDSQTGIWQLANKPAGQNIHPDNTEAHLLSMKGLVVNHILQFNIATHTADANLIAQAFKVRLTQIIQHCIASDRSYYTPSDFNTIAISRSLLDELQARDPNIEAIFKANSLQQGFIYHALSQVDDDAYRVQLLLDYQNPINVDAYKKAWLLAIQTYPILRTYFNWDEDVIQIVTQQGNLDFTYHDSVSSVEAIQQADRAMAFDLQKPTQLRIHLMKHCEDHYTLLKSEHHVIIDGWSGPILLGQVHQYYQSLIKNIMPQIVPDNAYLQTQVYIAANKNLAKAYWQAKLQTVEHANDLNPLLSRTTNLERARVVATPKEAIIQVLIPKSFLRQHGLTLHVLAQFTWHKLIHTYTRNARTIVGTTVSGRGLPVSNIESSVGLYINTLPLVIDWTSTQPILELLKQIEADVLAMNEYSFVELALLQKDGARLFHSLFVFENYPVDEVRTEALFQVCFRDAIEKLDYPLGVMAYENKHGLNVTLKYDGDFLDDTKAQQLLAQFKLIFEQIAKQHTQPHHTLNLITKAEYKQIVIDWNKTEEDYPKDKTIHQLFEEQVKKTPNNIAVVFEDQQLTYKQLNEEANQLARYIHKQNPGECVAICMDRSLEMIIAILGILKAGCAYVPIDPNYPQERIDYILADTKASLVLDNRLKDKPCAQESKENQDAIVRPNDLAYVIYTSGTTGRPKGVMIPHSGIVNRLHWMQQQYPINERDVVLHKTPYHFDVSVWELLWAHQYGAKLVIAKPEGHKESDYLYQLMLNHRVTIAHFVPSMLSVFTQAVTEFPSTLRYIFCSGEALSAAQVNATYTMSDSLLKIHNLYGPTEASIDVTAFACERGMDVVCIGKPIQNIKVYVLDPGLAPLPVGTVGELYIGGVGLSLGYLNQPELTKARFIPNPFGAGRLYKTGDLVRWLPDGNLEYIGRNDFQVKIRGYRIELGEIEHVLALHPDIKQSV